VAKFNLNKTRSQVFFILEAWGSVKITPVYAGKTPISCVQRKQGFLLKGGFLGFN